MIDKKDIKKKKERLENAKTILKEKFFGIDDVIDKFISSVESWYLFPEFRSRPLIINLWGITGVGKTALVREFAMLLGMENKYCEISKTYDDLWTLSGALSDSGITYDTNGILFIDEFQQLKTKNEKDEEIDQSEVPDLWTFLSDGTFPVPFNMKSQIESLITDIKEDKTATNKKKNSKIGAYYASKIYNTVKSFVSVTLEHVQKFNTDEAIDLLKSVLDRSETYLAKPYSKILIIISGNLDEAFSFASEVDDADTDPDYMNKLSKKITVTDIKGALLKRFRPEQISRLGNTHIIYPVLPKSAYTSLINKSISKIEKDYRDGLGIDYHIHQSLKDAVYDNGVFPMQGVRPLFSTMTSFIENSISYFSSLVFDSEKKEFVVEYDKGSQEAYLSDMDGNEIARYKVESVLENIRNDVSYDEKVWTCVHESGHAIAEAALFNFAPPHITSKSASTGTGGFCELHTADDGTANDLYHRIMASLCGRAAEEVVFGKEHVTSGASSDLEVATAIEMKANGKLGFRNLMGVYDDASMLLSRTEDMDADVDNVLKKAYMDSIALIKSNKEFLIALTEELLENGSMKDTRFIEIAENFGYHDLNTNDKTPNGLHNSFADMFEKFKKKRFIF